ncbi:toxin Cry1Ac domain D-VI-related protein, partial [Listeria booriae]|uniref:toxin Cry1Ac domain D-VI-related protein n=1 Tax=Listeria booriae TaxID=1552123 RepID=UPI00162A1116
ARQAVDALFNNNTPTSNAIKATTTQRAIDDAQKLVDMITDAGVKAARQADLDKAQSLLDAKNEAAAEQAKQTAARQAVDALFNNNTPTSNAIKATTTQKAIDDAQKLVDMITDAGVKAARQADLDKAQNLLDARTAQAASDQAQKAVANYAVNQLFVSNNPTSDAIKASTDQDAIDNVQAEIDKINDTTIKAGLQTTLDRAQELLDERNATAKQVEEAKKIIDELFNNGNTNGSLKDTTNQAAIDKAQEKIDAVLDAGKKAELQKELDAAQKQLDDRNSAAEAEKDRQEKATAYVKDLFKDSDTNGSLKDITDQVAIDKAQEAIDAVTDPTVKESLQKDLDKAKALLVSDKITNIDTHIAGTGYVKGTTSPGVTRVGLFVNGVLVKTAAASNGEFQIYAGGTPEMKIAGQIFEIAALTSTNVAGVKTASIVSPKATTKLAAPTINDFYKGEGYVTGTVPTGTVKVALYIDGMFIRYGTITGNDFKIYGYDVSHLKTHGKAFHVLVEDATGKQSDLTASTVKLKDTTITPDDATTKSSYLTGLVLSDNASRIALYVDGEFIRHGAITKDGYRVYAYDVKALKQVGAEYEIYVLDSGNNVLTSIKETVK